MQFVQSTLKKHFCDSACKSEVAVYLKGGVRIKEIRIDAAASALRLMRHDRTQGVLYQAKGMVAIQQARPKVDLPGQTPASSFISADFQRLAGSVKKFRRVARVDLVAWKQPV